MFSEYVAELMLTISWYQDLFFLRQFYSPSGQSPMLDVTTTWDYLRPPRLYVPDPLEVVPFTAGGMPVATILPCSPAWYQGLAVKLSTLFGLGIVVHWFRKLMLLFQIKFCSPLVAPTPTCNIHSHVCTFFVRFPFGDMSELGQLRIFNVQACKKEG